jgi:hypothetical protein
MVVAETNKNHVSYPNLKEERCSRDINRGFLIFFFFKINEGFGNTTKLRITDL